MKRVSGILCILLSWLIGVTPMSAAAQGAVSYLTDYEYASLQTGGENGTFVFTAYDADGFKMGTADSTGELTRTSYSLSGWDALTAQERFAVTVTGDAGELCPYASTHSEQTICPYFQVARVTLTDTHTGVQLENYYIPSDETVMLPDGEVHFCWGRYGYRMPVTLKWDGESDYIALRNSEGLWGVYDINEHDMITEYVYSDMSEIYGEYAKVYNGEKWGRLDVGGRFDTVYMYDTAEEFSVKEELRLHADGSYQVFSKDNEVLSDAFVGAWKDVSYEASSHLLYAEAEDGTTMLIDLNGDTVETFEASMSVRHLQDDCYAVEKYNDDGTLYGIALVRADGVVKPQDSIVKGDVNFDGAIDSTDVRLTLSDTVNAKPLTDRQRFAADMDDNGVVKTADARSLIVAIVS